MKKLGQEDFEKLNNALYDVSKVLIEYEKSEDKYDKILIRNLSYTLNDMLGEVYAYQLGYKQEV